MRNRNYYRKMRAKHIRRKKRIEAQYGSDYPMYRHDGQYSKGKIHCSCPICKAKAYYGKHVLSIQEKRNSYIEDYDIGM